jgi:hypothetical protein
LIEKKLTGSAEGFGKLSPKAQSKLLRQKISDDAPYAMFFLLPYFALLLKWLFRKKKMLYGGHLLFSLHLHSFAFIVMSLGFLPLTKTLHSALLWVIAAYLFLALRRVYGRGWKATLWRMGLLYMFYIVAVGATMLSGVLAAVFGGEAT